MRKVAFLGLATLGLSVGVGVFAACGSDNVPLYANTDGGPGADGTSTAEASPGGPPTQTGRIVDLSAQGTGVPMAAITLGSVSLMADAKGNYSAQYPANTPVSMTVSAANYYKLIEGEWFITGDVSRANTRLLSDDTAKSLLGALGLSGPAYDPTLGVVSVWVIPQAPCTTDANAVIDIMPKVASTHVTYFGATGLPDGTVGSTVAGQNPHAAIYNVPINTQLTFTITHPTCGLKAFPATDDSGFTYTGKIHVEAGSTNVVSFFRLFMGAPNPAPDAGADTDAGSDAGDLDAGDAE